MATAVKYYTGTEAQILSLSPASPQWAELAFYYPTDKTYFYRIVNNSMQKYGAGDLNLLGIGILLNDKVLGGFKSYILPSDVLTIPENYEYNGYLLNIEGVVNCNGTINIL